MGARKRGKIYDQTQGHCAFCGRKLVFTENWRAIYKDSYNYAKTKPYHGLSVCRDCLDAFYTCEMDLDSLRRSLKEKLLRPIDEHTIDMLGVLCPVFTYQPLHNTDELRQHMADLSCTIDDAQFVFYYEKQLERTKQ